MLYAPDAFEPLTGEAWDAERVQAAVRGIVADVDAAWEGPQALWPADEWDGWRAATPMKNLYVGAAGVLLALDLLRRRELADTRLDLETLAADVLELQREQPDFMQGIELPTPRGSSLLCGETGVALVAWRLRPTAALADDVERLVRANVENDADDLMWGVPGTLVAARAMLDWTGEVRWRETWDESAAALVGRRNPEGLWAQHLYGEAYRGLGTAHGLVGNVLALLPLLDDDLRRVLERTTTAILTRTAVVEDELANWPSRVEGAGELHVQWCNGAPGILSSTASFLEEELLLASAELVWRAGPHGSEKGASICHGTAGSAYALLATFERTGDAFWLDRARRLAVHALGQVHAARAERGRGRYSLWTGDLGVALLAADCLDGGGSYPLLAL